MARRPGFRKETASGSARGTLALALLLACLAAFQAAPAWSEPSWPTYHRDAARSGDDPETGEAVEPAKAWQSPDLGAPIWSEPLVLGSRVYVATVGDRLYALDAATGAIVWSRSAGTPVPASALPCGDITPTVGIVGTPVIDPAAQVIYVVADTWNASKGQAHHYLKGFRLAGGERILSTRVDPAGQDPKVLLQRTALNLAGGRVVFGFGGNQGDCGSYRGAIVSVPSEGGAPSFWVYRPASPAVSGAGVWATSGPAVDAQGNVYVSTGNPNTSGGEATTYDYSDSLLELSGGLSLLGNFEPPTWQYDSNHDIDLGSAGPALLPGGYIFQGGKNGRGYLFAQSSFGAGAKPLYEAQICGGSRSVGGDAFASGVIYAPCNSGVQALRLNSGTSATFTPLWQGPTDANGPPIVSAGHVWAVATGGFAGGGTKLYGLDPSTGAVRYTETLPSPVADHFATPAAAGGRLIVATGQTVTAYRVARVAEGPAVTGISPQHGSAGGGTTVTITGSSFTGVTAVKFGSKSAKSFTVVSAGTISAVTPAEPVGVVDVSVTTSSGTSPLTSKDRFKFTPVVTKITPSSGPTGGGTSVTVTGKGFAVGTTGTTFKFGTATAPQVNCSTSTSCVVVSPAHEAATVDVKATVKGISSPRNAPADRFVYG